MFWEYGASGGFKQDEISVLSQHDSFSWFHFNFMSLWGIPFILIGQYMIWGRFIYTAWKKTHTFYAATNKRVLVLNTGTSRKLTDASISRITSLSLTTRTDGAGTIEFAPEPEISRGWMNTGIRNRGQQMTIDLSRLAFYDIPNAREVYNLIQTKREDYGSNANTVFRPT